MQKVLCEDALVLVIKSIRGAIQSISRPDPGYDPDVWPQYAIGGVLHLVPLVERLAKSIDFEVLIGHIDTLVELRDSSGTPTVVAHRLDQAIKNIEVAALSLQ